MPTVTKGLAAECFVASLGELPETVNFTSRLSAQVHLAVCFIRSSDELAEGIDLLHGLAVSASAWIVYPKKTSNRHRDFNENDVRKSALSIGLVDYKICWIDAEWSAMKFAWRKGK